MAICPLCGECFQHRDRLRKHHRAVHRDTSPISSKVFSLTPEEIPEHILSLKVLMLYAAETTPPAGFLSSQLPLMKMKYSKDMAEHKAIVDYNEYRERFALEIVSFFMKHATYIKAPKSSEMM